MHGNVRIGLSVPLPGIAPGDARALLEEAQDLGYSELWSMESDAHDGFTPLALAAQWVPKMRLGTSIANTFTRGPALLAQTAATLAELAPGRFILGIGSSSHAIVEGWNGIAFAKPYTRTRDVLHFLRRALRGEKITERFDSFDIRGFRLGISLPSPPPIFLAALRPRMISLAAQEADGIILNWLSAADLDQVMAIVRESGRAIEVIDRVKVCPNPDADAVRAAARPSIAAYLNTPVYAAYHRWLGRADVLAPMWAAWAAGDRKAALAAIPDALVDELVVHGSAEQCREKLARYARAGVTTICYQILPIGVGLRETLRALAPQHGT
ncbi:MAG: LLM class F420-dependent oxidoreductase [Gammaproteobacteria bacterium]